MPIIALLTSSVLISEKIDSVQLLGFAITIVGIAIVNQKEPKPESTRILL